MLRSRTLMYLGVVLLSPLLATAKDGPDKPGKCDSTADHYVFQFVDLGNAPVPVSIRNTELKAGSEIEVWYDINKVGRVDIQEKPRPTRFADDLSKLTGKLLGAGAPAGSCTYRKASRPLNEDHGTITVTAYDPSDKVLETVTVISGAREHVYLGLDLPVNSVKNLKYDSASKSLLPQNSNPQLYLSANYYFGDLADKNETGIHPSLKALILANSRPFDSYGVGVGIKLGEIKAIGVDLSGLSVFSAFTWDKEDAVVTGLPSLNGGKTHHWRIGVSYDLGTALKWVKF